MRFWFVHFVVQSAKYMTEKLFVCEMSWLPKTDRTQYTISRFRNIGQWTYLTYITVAVSAAK